MQKTIEVHGMSCGHCEGRVKKELEKITGVESAEASAVDKEVVVILSEEIDNARLKEAVEEAGYEFIKVK